MHTRTHTHTHTHTQGHTHTALLTQPGLVDKPRQRDESGRLISERQGNGGTALPSQIFRLDDDNQNNSIIPVLVQLHV